MTRSTSRTRLTVEALEDRQLTATSLGSVMAFTPAVALSPAQEKIISAPLVAWQGGKAIVDNTSWFEGIRINHNETFVRTRRKA